MATSKKSAAKPASKKPPAKPTAKKPAAKPAAPKEKRYYRDHHGYVVGPFDTQAQAVHDSMNRFGTTIEEATDSLCGKDGK